MRPTLTVLACGDLHVDDKIQLAGLAPVERDTSEPLVLAQSRRMLAWIAEQIERVRPDLVTMGGDLYERPKPSPATEAVAMEGLARWCETAPVVAVLGNHDRSSGREAHALEPLRSLRPGRLFVVDRPDPLWVVRGDAGLELAADLGDRLPAAKLYCIPYPSRSYLSADTDSAEHTNAVMSQALDQVVAAHAADAAICAVPTIQVGHGTLRGARFNAHQVVALSDLAISTTRFDAFGLSLWSHLHMGQPVPGLPSRFAETHVYLGSVDRHDAGEEGEPKGVSVFRLQGGAWTREFIPYPGARDFLTLTPEFFLNEIDQELWAIGREQEYVLRVAGDVDEETFERVARKVRAMKSAHFIIANRCTVARTDRARVADVRADLGADGILDAVFVARADLAPRADVIRANVRELAGGAP